MKLSSFVRSVVIEMLFFHQTSTARGEMRKVKGLADSQVVELIFLGVVARASTRAKRVACLNAANEASAQATRSPRLCDLDGKGGRPPRLTLVLGKLLPHHTQAPITCLVASVSWIIHEMVDCAYCCCQKRLEGKTPAVVR
jgi:hypothetical protein